MCGLEGVRGGGAAQNSWWQTQVRQRRDFILGQCGRERAGVVKMGFGFPGQNPRLGQ